MTTTIPAGWKLVPIEPTIDMLADADETGNVLGPRARRIYAAMLNAAPAAPGVSTVEDPSFPTGAIVNGRTLADRLEAYPFESQGGDLRLCSDWVEFRRCFEYLAEWVGSRAPAAGDALDAARYRWLCDKFGITKLPCAIERIIEGSYVPDGKKAIDAAIDVAIAAQQGKGGAA